MSDTKMVTQMAPNLSYEIALVDFFSLLLLPASDRSCLHGGRQRRKLHLMNRKQIPGNKELGSHEKVPYLTWWLTKYQRKKTFNSRVQKDHHCHFTVSSLGFCDRPKYWQLL